MDNDSRILEKSDNTNYNQIFETCQRRGKKYFDQGDFLNSKSEFQKITHTQPDNGSAWLTIAYIEYLLKNHIGTVSAAKEVLRLDASSEQAKFFLAEALRNLGHYTETISYYESIISNNPNYYKALLGYSHALLATGNLESGWIGYEARQFCIPGTWQQHQLPYWNGETSPHLSILAFNEEGISADILYASCINDLIRQVGHCTVECAGPLHTLFARSFPNITILPVSETPNEQNYDAQVAFGSLPRHFRSNFNAFPMSRLNYLESDQAKVQYWQSRLLEKPGEFKIGILHEAAWSLETTQSQIPFDVITKLLEFSTQNKVHWISLQHGNRKKEWENYRKHACCPIDHYQEAFVYDLDYLAALLSSLDLVITPPGCQAYLAGALGVQTWVILPTLCDYRWHLSKHYSPWFPTVELFRQAPGETWAQTTRHLINALDHLINKRSKPCIIPFPNSPTKHKAIPHVA